MLVLQPAKKIVLKTDKKKKKVRETRNKHWRKKKTLEFMLWCFIAEKHHISYEERIIATVVARIALVLP